MADFTKTHCLALLMATFGLSSFFSLPAAPSPIPPSSPLPSDGGVVYAKGKKFLAEVARTDLEKAKGLMYRKYLKADRCMFFVYEEDGHHSIWMKNCLISLDVAWLNTEGRVVEIFEKAPPCSPLKGDDCPSYGGKVLSRYFVEFPAGSLRRLKLKVGDHLGWDLQFKDGTHMLGGAKAPAEPAKSASPKKKRSRKKH